MTREIATPSSQKPDDPQWYEDNELWLDLLAPLFLNHDGQAERAARLFHRLAKEIEKGSDGAYRVRCCLENARQLAFPYTRFASDCKALFIESLDEPEPLTLTAIMKRE